MWHTLFGEPNEQRLRADDPGVPYFLKWKDNEESYPKLGDMRQYTMMRSGYLRPE